VLQARSAWSLGDFVGVNIHTSEQSYYADTGLVNRLLTGLGVRHIRGACHETLLDFGRTVFIEHLAAQGIRSSFLIDPAQRVTARYVAQVLAAMPTAIEEWEGINEQTGTVNQTTQQAMYAAVRANPDTTAVPITAPSANDPVDVHDACDLACAHIYWNNRQPENNGYGATRYGAAYGSLAYNIGKAQASANRLVNATETGYYDLVAGGLDNDTKAIYTLRSVLMMYAAGMYRQYVYELLSHDNSSMDGTLGICYPDGTPKSAYVALQGLLARAADTYHVDTRNVDVTLSNDAWVNHLAFRKANGTVLLALWRGVQNVDPNAPKVVTTDADSNKTNVTVATGSATTRTPSWFYHGAWGTGASEVTSSATYGVGSSPLVVEILGLA